MHDVELSESAKNMRKNVLETAYMCGIGAHLGGSLSLIDILAVLYGSTMNCKDHTMSSEYRDKFILSKGHGALGLYTALAEFNIISKPLLKSFQKNGTDFSGLPIMNTELGIEISSGSLGLGLSMGVGLALSAKKKNRPYKTYVLCGNGECNEGSVWEAVMSAVNFGLDNLTVIVDNNGMQSDGDSKGIMNVRSLRDSFDSFGFDAVSIDGHDIHAMRNAFCRPSNNGNPRAFIAETIKGKGISFMENNGAWHHNRLTETQYVQALAELEDSV